MSEKYSLHLEGLTLEALAKVVLALKGTTAVVAGSGAATPQAATPQAAAPAPTYAAPAPAVAAAVQPVVTAAPVSAGVVSAPAPTAAASPSNGGALTYEDVTAAFKANLTRIKPPGVQAVNAQFGITSPLALKERPQDWAGYIAALNASPSA